MDSKHQQSAKFLSCLIGIFCFFSIQAQIPAGYRVGYSKWQKQRVAELLAPDGWVNLVGLFWLEPGKNAFGSERDNQIIYSHANMPAHAGHFILSGETVTWISDPGVSVTANHQKADSLVIFAKGTPPIELSLGTLRWTIIQREDKWGIRLRDLASPALKNFAGIDYFPLDLKWRVPAHLEKDVASNLQITNVLGQTMAVPSPGKLVFTLDNKEYRLDVLNEGDQLFIVFGDATSGRESYAAGRFL
ncbi:MAG: DUF1684 domain-containing protein, partial [Bacteroidota bacterium]|nr:DUF1684 domain-containing protein [Bacteroidota bacterium]